MTRYDVLQKKSFRFIEHNHDVIDVVSIYGGEEKPFDPLLWKNKGLYGVLSVEKILNAIEFGADAKNAPKLNRHLHDWNLHWQEVIVIHSNTAKVLLGEQ